VRKVDRILVFERGRIVEQGPHRALLARGDGRYRGLYLMQAAGLEALPQDALQLAVNAGPAPAGRAR
jgi:hypothetical protein